MIGIEIVMKKDNKLEGVSPVRQWEVFVKAFLLCEFSRGHQVDGAPLASV